MAANTKKNSFGLSKREAMFCEVYFSTFSRYAAAKAVSGDQDINLDYVASGILKKPEAQTYLVYLQETHIDKMIIDRNKLLDETSRFYQELKFKGKDNEALKALDMLNKICGVYNAQLNITQDITIKTNWGSTPTNQLLEGENTNLLDEGDEDDDEE